MPDGDRGFTRERAGEASAPRASSLRRPLMRSRRLLWVTASMSVLSLAVNRLLLQGALWRMWREILPEPVVTVGTMGAFHDVRKYGAGESGFSDSDRTERGRGPQLIPDEPFAPMTWDSSLCMEHWHRPELLTEVDPNGYVVFVNGMEQLVGSKHLLEYGAFIAKMLDRTLVEFPVKDMRISAANFTLGLGAYWALSEMCMSHRILDIRSFRRLVETGRLTPEDFVTIEMGEQQSTISYFRNEHYIQEYLRDKLQFKVIVMEHAQKSPIDHHPSIYLSPNSFYLGVARVLMRHTLRDVIENHRIRLGYNQNQVLFSTDLSDRTSGTNNSKTNDELDGEAIRRIREDYPKALDNRLHVFLNKIKDSGIKAIVSGLVVAQGTMLLGSSLNRRELKAFPEVGVCQKPFSGYVRLITQWRTRILQKDPETLVRLFPFGEIEDEDTSFRTKLIISIP